MAFWGGFARGRADALARKERDEEREAKLAWDTKVFDYKVSQDTYTRERQETLDKEDRERRDFERKLKLIQAGIPVAGSGGVVTPSTKTTKTSGVSPADAAAQTLILSKRVENAYSDLSDTDKEYYKTILKTPSAAHTLMTLISELEKDQKTTIKMSDVPTIIEIAGLTEGKEVDAYKLLQDNGVDLDDPEAILEAARVVKSYVAPSVVLDVKAEAYGVDKDFLELQEKAVIGNLVAGVPALIKSGNLDPTIEAALKRAMIDIKDSDPVISTAAKDTILTYMMTPDTLAQLEKQGGLFRNVTENQLLTMYNTLPTSTTEPTTPAPVVTAPSEVSFNSLDDFKKNQTTATAIPPETWVSIGGTPYFVDKDGTLKQHTGG